MEEIERWASCARDWQAGSAPGLPVIDRDVLPVPQPRDVFVYFMHEGKVRAPHAAMALMQSLVQGEAERKAA